MAYFERLWSDVADRPPEHFALRRDYLLEQLAGASTVIDVGCGAGWFAAALAQAGHAVVGVEVASEPLRRARERAGDVRFELVAENRLPFAAQAFDAAWLGEVIEHVQDGVGLLSEVARVLSPQGRLVLSTPDHGPLLRARLGVSRRAFERHFEPRSDHVRFFTARTLRSLLAATGFEEIRIAARGGVLLASARAPR